MMRKVTFLAGLLALVLAGAGCNSKGANQSAQGGKAGQKVAGDKELAAKFLLGVQNGDKNKVYEAANLTQAMVDDSREKLVHAAQHKQTEQQRLNSEHALRTSGNIDFFIKKTRKMLPPSASFMVVGSKVLKTGDDASHSVHDVKISYGNRAEAMIDKSGKPIKEMMIHLQQVSRMVNGSWIHDFSFDGRDFEKMSERDFEVITYFQ